MTNQCEMRGIKGWAPKLAHTKDEKILKLTFT